MLANKNKCCGCEACVNVCKFNAIQMKCDDSLFKYPVIDKDKCKNCKLCEKVCPINNKKTDDSKINRVYAGYNLNNSDLYKSASGGISYLLNEYFLKNNGIIYGVSYSKNYKSAEYIRVDNIKNLRKIQSSKYIETNKNNIYNLVKIDLENSKKVLFTGLPCEIGALKSFLKKEYYNLYTCALICMGPTSQKVQKEFIEYYENKSNSLIKYFNVRSKVKGWGPPNHIELILQNNKKIVKPFNENAFGTAFQVLSRTSCLDCNFKITNTYADITIGDYWGVDKNSEIYNKNGVSVILTHNDRFNEILNQISSLRIIEITYEEALNNNDMIEKSRILDKRRNKFIKDFNHKGLMYAHKKANSWYKSIAKKILPQKIIKVIKGENK